MSLPPLCHGQASVLRIAEGFHFFLCGMNELTLVRQLIDTIRVVGENKLEIIFRSGLTYEQDISPKVKKLVRIS